MEPSPHHRPPWISTTVALLVALGLAAMLLWLGRQLTLDSDLSRPSLSLLIAGLAVVTGLVVCLRLAIGCLAALCCLAALASRRRVGAPLLTALRWAPGPVRRRIRRIMRQALVPAVAASALLVSTPALAVEPGPAPMLSAVASPAGWLPEKLPQASDADRGLAPAALPDDDATPSAPTMPPRLSWNAGAPEPDDAEVVVPAPPSAAPPSRPAATDLPSSEDFGSRARPSPSRMAELPTSAPQSGQRHAGALPGANPQRSASPQSAGAQDSMPRTSSSQGGDTQRTDTSVSGQGEASADGVRAGNDGAGPDRLTTTSGGAEPALAGEDTTSVPEQTSVEVALVPDMGSEPSTSSVVVAPGDSLWAIAAAHLAPGSSDADIDAAWRAWYEANREVIGSDPGLIQPGQHLRAPGGAA